jgi:hypothetical protein
MQSPFAHHVPHCTVQALRARGKRAVILPHAFGLRSIVAGWTWCARTRGGRGVRDARMIFNAHHVSYACMQSPRAHHALHNTVQALCARGKREVALPHAFGCFLLSLQGGPGLRLRADAAAHATLALLSTRIT